MTSGGSYLSFEDREETDATLNFEPYSLRTSDDWGRHQLILNRNDGTLSVRKSDIGVWTLLLTSDYLKRGSGEEVRLEYVSNDFKLYKEITQLTPPPTLLSKILSIGGARRKELATGPSFVRV